MRRRAIPAAAALCAVSAAAAPDVAAIRADVAAIRGLDFKRPFDADLLDREALRRILEEEIDREAPPETFAALGGVYRMLGLIPADCDLRAATLEILTLGIGGVYFPRRGALYYMKDLSGMAEAILAHEIQHALQDQHWPIAPRDAARKDNGDAAFAYHAVVEGDAMEVMHAYQTRRPSAARLSQKDLVAQLFNGAALTKYPPILTEPLMMPYLQGQRFVKRLRARGGWARVNAALDAPPASTEQVLHPEKFLRGDDPPRSVALPDLARLSKAGWRRLREDTFGEWMTSVIVRFLTDDAVKGLRAGAGWGGDRFAYYEDGDGRGLLVWGSVWDAEKDAAEFRDFFLEGLSRRAPEGVRVFTALRGAAVFAAAGHLDEAAFREAAKLFEKSNDVK